MAKPIFPNPLPPATQQATGRPLTLSIDIGGSHVKVGMLDPEGTMLEEPARVVTPDPATPEAVLEAIAVMVGELAGYSRISAGFPGVVKDGTIWTAPNLGTPAWRGFPLAAEIARRFGQPTRVLNDAAVQAFGVIAGRGLECVITLGTGMGFCLFRNGVLMPQMEMGQHLAHGSKSYDHYVGEAARKAVGRKRWNRRVLKVIAALDTLLNYDMLHIGGGNASKLEDGLPERVRTASNRAGITGGVRLWEPAQDAWFDQKAVQAGGSG